MGRFMVGLGQLGTVHGRVRSVHGQFGLVQVSLGRFMVDLGQLGSVHGRVGSVWVNSWVSLGRCMVGLGRFMVSLG